MVPPRVLIIDDEKNIRKTLGLVLGGENYEVVSFGTAEEGLKYLESDGADLLILDVIGELPDDLRTAITLREIEGMSYEEIAQAMNCPVGTVRSRIFRAREALDKRLRPLLEQ